MQIDKYLSDQVFYNKDLFSLVCDHLHWRDLKRINILSLFHKKIIYSKLACAVNVRPVWKLRFIKNQVGIRLIDALMSQEYSSTEFIQLIKSGKYFSNCFYLNLSGVESFDWIYLLNCDNCCYHLDLQGYNWGFFSDNKIIINDMIKGMYYQYDNWELLKFLNQKLNAPDLKMFLLDPLGQAIENDQSNKKFIYLERISFNMNNDTFMLSDILNLSDSDERYQFAMDEIRKQIRHIGDIKKKYYKLKRWFSSSKINVLNLSYTNIPEDIIQCLTGCKKIYMQGINISFDTMRSLKNHGVILSAKNI